MVSRSIVLMAMLVYAAVLGCVLMPGEGKKVVEEGKGEVYVPVARGVSADRKGILPLRGCGMQIQRVDWMDKYKESVDEIADVGADTVMFEVDARMENGTSSRIYLDMRMTPTPDQLSDLIDHAKKRGLRVVLMPVVLLDNPRGDEWRGTLKPTSWDEWFESYRDVMTHFAWIAEGHHVDVLVIGSELVSAENKTDEWDATIHKVRSVFHGLITYSSNWDHYTSVPFWKKLDLVGMNSYWKMGDDKDVTVEEIKEHWAGIQKDVLAFTKKQGKPLLLVEAGWCSLENAATDPWDYTVESAAIDNDLQKRLYEGFFESWYGNPNLGGFMMWEWTPGDGGKGAMEDRRGYTPEKKPAEGVLRSWMAKPWKGN